MTQLTIDPRLSHGLGQNGLATVESQYSWEQICDRVIDSYHIALKIKAGNWPGADSRIPMSKDQLNHI
jgi:hypothetical protein